MKNSFVYRLSLGFTILLTLAAFFTLVGWLGRLINGLGHLSLLALFPWQTLGLVALAALNCTIRARIIVRRNSLEVSE